MSRIGKKQIQIPDNVEVSLEGGEILAKGPKGTLRESIHPFIRIEKEGSVLLIKQKEEGAKEDAKNVSSLWGLTRALTANMIKGVTDGFSKVLEIDGVGYRAQIQGRILQLQLGFSHSIQFPIPEGIEMKVAGNTVEVSGVKKQLVNQTAAKIRALKKPEPYKGKGIHYKGEVIKRKAGKRVAAAATAA